MRTWFNVKALADRGAEVSIYDEIGAYGVSAKGFIDGIKPFKGQPISVSINSPGGDMFAGLAIYNALRQHGADVTVRVMGVAASAASLIAMAGDKVLMPANTFMMVHNPWTFAIGNAEELRGMADTLDKLGQSLVSTYVARTGKDEDSIKKMLAAETWLSAAEAVEGGFADEVEELLEVSAKFDTERLPEPVRAVFAKAVPQFEPRTALVDQIKAAADNAGLGEFAEAWALDPAIESIEALTPRLHAAREIVATCAFAKMPEKAADFIKANEPVRAVRAKLATLKAEADEERIVDTAPRASKQQVAASGKPSFSYRDAYRHLTPSN